MPGLTAVLVAAAGAIGLIVGSILNVLAYRVPAGIPLTRESRCPACEAPTTRRSKVPLIGWLLVRGKCDECGARLSVRSPTVEVVTALAFAGVAWYFLAASEPSRTLLDWAVVGILLVAYWYFAAISIVLTLIDLDTRRLPNAIVLPSYAVAGALLTIAALLSSDWQSLVRAAVSMTVLFAFYSILSLIRPAGMGGGDVKLAGVIGLYLGWIGWGAVAVGAFAAFLFGGLYGIALILLRRAGRRTAIPFGPWMILGAWTGIVAGQTVGQAYLALYASA